jgi:phage-related protein
MRKDHPKTVTLSVPANALAYLTQAALEQIVRDTEALTENVYTFKKWREEGKARDENAFVDVRETAKLVARTTALADQLCAATTGPVEVESDKETLASVFEHMVRNVLEPQLATEASYGPFEAKELKSITALTELIGWGTAQAARLNAEFMATLKAAREQVAA